jgi:hypothetical protein
VDQLTGQLGQKEKERFLVTGFCDSIELSLQSFICSFIFFQWKKIKESHLNVLIATHQYYYSYKSQKEK